MMDDLDHSIAAAAAKIAPILRDQGASWPAPSGSKRQPSIMPQRFAPEPADVALVLRRLVDDLKPGTRLEDCGMVVEWLDRHDTGPDDHISFSVIVHTAPAPAK